MRSAHRRTALVAAQLLPRTRVLRPLWWGTVLAALLVTVATTWIQALSLSAEQRLSSTLGTTAASITPINQAPEPPGRPALGVPAWITTVATESHATIHTERRSQLPARLAHGTQLVLYREATLPSPFLAGGLELVSGQWPARAGECVSNGAAATFQGPALGTWPIHIVGGTRTPYQPNLAQLTCAPGTWERWTMPNHEVAVSGTSANSLYYIEGDTAAVAGSLTRRAPTDAASVEVVTAADFRDTVSAQRILADRMPFLLIPLVVAAVFSSLVSRWATRVSHHLYLAGLARPVVRRTILAATLTVAGLGGLLGGLAGLLLGWFSRPLLQAFHHIPLNNVQPDPLTGAVTGASCLLGAGLGYWAASVRQPSPKHPDVDQLPSSWSPQRQAFAAVLLVALGALLMIFSDGRYPTMIGGATTLTAGFAAGAPVVLTKVIRRGSRPVNHPTVLAERLLRADDRRWAVNAFLWAMIAGLMCAVVTFSTSSVAGTQALTTSTLPAGSAMLATQVPEGSTAPSDAVIARFERELDLAHPVVIRQALAWPGVGLVWTFGSLSDVERVLGPLSGPDRDALTGGGVLSSHVTKPTTIDLMAGDSVITVPARPTPASAPRYVSAGFALTGIAPTAEAKPYWTQNLYLRLSPQQDAAARSWTTETGLRGVFVESYRDVPLLSLPLWTIISFVGFGVLATPLLAYSSRREARALRPVFAELWCLGVPSGFQSAVLARLIGAMVLTAFTLAITSSVTTQAILALTYPGQVFNPAGVPWWTLAVFGATLTGAAIAAAWMASTRLSRTEVEQVV